MRSGGSVLVARVGVVSISFAHDLRVCGAVMACSRRAPRRRRDDNSDAADARGSRVVSLSAVRRTTA